MERVGGQLGAHQSRNCFGDALHLTPAWPTCRPASKEIAVSPFRGPSAISFDPGRPAVLLGIRRRAAPKQDALAAGAGGAMGQARRSVAGVLPGAAIAVSLMPPLCVTGISFALQLSGATPPNASPFAMLYGSTLLWLANLAAINLAAILIFVLLGFRKIRKDEDQKHFRRRVSISAVLVLLLTFPLVAFLQQTIRQSREQKTARETLMNFAVEVLDEEAQLDSFRVGAVDPRTGWRHVVATFYSPRLPDRSEVIDLRETLAESMGSIELRVIVNPVYTFRENPVEGSISERPKRKVAPEDQE